MEQTPYPQRLQAKSFGDEPLETRVHTGLRPPRAAGNDGYAAPAEFANLIDDVRFDRRGEEIGQISNGGHEAKSSALASSQFMRAVRNRRVPETNRRRNQLPRAGVFGRKSALSPPRS